MRNLTGIVVLAVLAGIVPGNACGANLLRPDWAGRELHLVDRDTGASNSNLYWRVPNAVLKDVRGKAPSFCRGGDFHLPPDGSSFTARDRHRHGGGTRRGRPHRTPLAGTRPSRPRPHPLGPSLPICGGHSCEGRCGWEAAVCTTPRNGFLLYCPT